MEIFEFTDFRQIISHLASARGDYARLARAIKLHSTTFSQVMNGLKPLSLEHAILVCDELGLKSLETKFFLLLVQLDKAGSERLRANLREQLNELKRESQNLQRVVPTEQNLSFEQKAVFYSHWLYSGIRVMSSISGFQTAEALAKRLGTTVKVVREKIDFLVQSGLCVEKNGKLAPGPNYTHLENHSPLIARLHANWRMKAMERHSHLEESELAYSSPMSLSEKDALKVREKLVRLVREVNEIRDPSPCETAYCLNLDWTKF